MFAKQMIRMRGGAVEAGAAIALYGVYEIVRGLGGEDWSAARLHTADIVAFERSLGVFWEHGIQAASASVPGLPGLLGVLYIALHFLATIGFLVWVHRRRPDAFAVVRTTLVTATALALVGYLTFPAAPPRLAGLGFTDTVTKSAGVNLSSDALGALYNPLAAVPSLHFGYALLVGAGLADAGAAALGADRRRPLPGRDAVHHRRDGQPLLRRRTPRRSGRRGRLVRRAGPRSGRGSALAAGPRPTPEASGSAATRSGAPYARSTSGTSPWKFSRIASRARSVTTVPLSV